jgi:hypothetical protein
MTGHHRKQFAFLSLTSSIQITVTPRVALEDVACELIKQESEDGFTIVKDVM